MTPLSAKAKLLLIKKVKSGQKIAKVCREAGISRKTFYFWLKKYKSARPNLVHISLSDKRYKTKISYKALHPKDKLLVINKVFNKEDSIAGLCRNWGISRKTFYLWLKRYQKYGEEGLADFRPGGEEHPRAISAEVKAQLLNYVASNPDYSVHNLNKQLDFIGHHGIQNILAHEDLNTVAHRQLFAQGYMVQPQIQVAPLYEPQIPLYRLRQILAPFATIPKLIFTKPKIGIPVFIATLLPVSLFLVWLRLLVFVPPAISRFGLLFATISLFFGMFFFLYSLKYYISVLLVLKFSQNPTDYSNKPLRGILGKLTKYLGFGNNRTGVNPLSLKLESVKLLRRPFVSIHVALYNEKRVVERLIAACTGQKWANYELILADDSTDETTEIAKQSLIADGWKLVTTKDQRQTTNAENQALGVSLSALDNSQEI